ncbi:YkoF family thiamine/hydroxymethylpyrimidine-binding protein [Alkalicoccus urumqiensis]|uniref:Thiamine-binding protein n=1 Tax=Alkalicoccus urumqiensis TaxID=1548213 RepID=A0A2P6MJ09_ALKUR|nr:YkoF family thiamine/hydroxymethylpyrimidine-binding protein [Alkalicoccus urumqiensis]PRO66240.1 thiamine-binding protein [Alkalicoccus urumqiensis]
MEMNQCGTSRITGVRFAVYPMTDRFVDVIKGALQETDTSKVWMETDDVTTCIRGKTVHVFDAAKAVFLHAAKTGEHVVFNGTFSIGCPGDNDADVYLAENDTPANEESLQAVYQETASHFALYPMGRDDYMQVIADACSTAEDLGVFSGGVHYASRLDGDGKDVFTALERIFTDASKEDGAHVTMTAAISANSPSKKGGGK